MNSPRNRLLPMPERGPNSPRTIFEEYFFGKPDKELIYVSPPLFDDGEGESAIAIFADSMPKFPGQFVVAPLRGTPGRDQRVKDLDTIARILITETGAFAASRLEGFAGKIAPAAPDPIAVIHMEGRGVRDHAHVVTFLSSRRGDGIGLYLPEQLGPEEVARVADIIRLKPAEVKKLDKHLGHIATRLS